MEKQLIFIPGGGASRNYYEYLLKEASNRGFKVSYLDTLGERSPKSLTKKVSEFIRRVSLPDHEVYIIAHSLGCTPIRITNSELKLSKFNKLIYINPITPKHKISKWVLGSRVIRNGLLWSKHKQVNTTQVLQVLLYSLLNLKTLLKDLELASNLYGISWSRLLPNEIVILGDYDIVIDPTVTKGFVKDNLTMLKGGHDVWIDHTEELFVHLAT